MTGELLPGYFVEPETGAWLTLRKFPLDGSVRTLGFDVVRWVESNLQNHLTGEPWRYTRGQLNFLLWWYAIRDDGRWLYRSGVKRGAKGTGKDPLLATLALAELCGPTRPTAAGTGEQHRMALVQIAANSEGQARDPLRVANAMVGADMAAEYGFDKGQTRTQLANGSRIELLTNSEASSEGDPATAIFLNESHHMKESSGGQAIAAVARRNVGKSPGGLARVLELTNAHMPGESSAAEDSFEAWQAQVSGRTRRRDILYDSREAPPHLSIHDEAQLMEGLAAAYGDAPWQLDNLDRIRDEAQDTRTSMADSIRYYFSSLPTSEDAWVDPRKFDALARPELVVEDGEPVAMFLDCSKSSDATVLCASRISDGHVIALGGWQRPHGDRGKGWLAPREDVDAAVMAAKDRYDVQWFGVDPSPARSDEDEAVYWAEMVDKWHRDFRGERDGVLVWATPGAKGSSVAFDMRQSIPGGRDRIREFTEVAEQTAESIDDTGTLTWDGNSMLRMHVHNARRRQNAHGVSLGKRTRDSSQLVDFAVAMVGARLGRRRILNSGKTRRKSSGKAMFV